MLRISKAQMDFLNIECHLGCLSISEHLHCLWTARCVLHLSAPAAGGGVNISSNTRVIEYPELEVTHKDHQVQHYD